MEKVIFLSDTHFKYKVITDEEIEKRKLFISFINDSKGVSRLYLLGDIFDFWFEHKGTEPSYYQDIISALTKLKDSGTKIYIIGGNHDYWLGHYIEEVIGNKVLPELYTETIQGRNITMTHGDMLLRGNFGYKILRAVIRNRLTIKLAERISPTLLFAFASRFSRTSKGITHKRTERSAKELIERAKAEFFKWENDAFIMGHIHYPYHETIDGKDFIILGDWEEHYSYAVLEGGVFTLERYLPGKKTLSENL